MLHDIVKDFPGSQDGITTQQFRAGTQAELSDYLAAMVVPAGWARPIQTTQTVEIDNKAVTTTGARRVRLVRLQQK